MRLSYVLARVPAIKFRKGGLNAEGESTTAASPPTSASASAASSPQMQTAAKMSTSISDTKLPRRYKRIPISQEEIDYINGGGIV